MAAAARNDASWVGTLRVGQAQIPMKMTPASKNLAINLRMTCPLDGERIEQVYVCSSDPEHHHHLDRGPGRSGDTKRCGRAYEFEDGSDLIDISYEELESLKSNEEQVIDIIETRSAYGFDPAFIKQTYRSWTTPAHEVAMASLCRALDRQQLIAIGRMVMKKRVYLVALRTDGRKSLEVLRLNWHDEVLTRFPVTTERADPAMVKAFTEFFSMIEVPVEEEMASEIRNERDDKLKELIRRKSGKEAIRTLAASIEYGGAEPA